MILVEDFYGDPNKIQEVNPFNKISRNEACVLLGFLIQNEINFSLPSSPFIIQDLKKKTYELMQELQSSFMIPYQKDLKKLINSENVQETQNKPFSHATHLMEPIFYGSHGVYDFQYLDFLPKKYKYDTDWLEKNRQFYLEKSKKIVTQIKGVLEEKIENSGFYSLKDLHPGIDELIQKYAPADCPTNELQMTKKMAELHQYSSLFVLPEPIADGLSDSEKRNASWKAFYNRLIDLFVVKRTDFDQELDIDSFFKNFSFSPQKDFNMGFKDIVNYNMITSLPILKLDEERYFIPISSLLHEAIYESPYYWMFETDPAYRDQLAENKGRVGEEIAYEFLSKVFGEKNTFKNIQIKSLKAEQSTRKVKDVTDIDILCVLGSKALCVQVKSKKLTISARSGEDSKLKKDFEGAIQHAYEQGIISRKKILSRDSIFFTPNGNEIKLSEAIDDAYIMCITLENYPALTSQVSSLLSKAESDPYPLVLSIFDLELVTHYLSDPYDFMYYIRQRITLMDYFRAENEIGYLSYHLQRKLWSLPRQNLVFIGKDFATAIDRNYYPLKAGLKVSDEGDIMKTLWKDESFDKFCEHIKTLDQPKITDIIFYLLDLSGVGRNGLMMLIKDRKSLTSIDGKDHNATIPPPRDKESPNIGFTWMSFASGDIKKLETIVGNFCLARKYKSKADIWIGFGSLRNSKNIIDLICLIEKPWEYDADSEKVTKLLLSKPGQIRSPKKIGRNEKCPCNLTNLKYKKCCGKNM